jgi:hypothetical protein
MPRSIFRDTAGAKKAKSRSNAKISTDRKSGGGRSAGLEGDAALREHAARDAQ